MNSTHKKKTIIKPNAKNRRLKAKKRNLTMGDDNDYEVKELGQVKT